MKFFEARGVSMFFGGLRAVDSVDFSIDQGEIVGLIGPNGAGKTTFFNILTGFLKPTAGTFLFEDQDITGRPPHAIAEMGIVRTFQKTNLFSDVTVFEGVSIGFHKHRHCGMASILLHGSADQNEKREIAKATWEILEFTGLTEWAEVSGKNLPYGKQRILALALALAASPKLLLLDEPATGLNPKEAQELMGLIHRIRDEKKITVCLIEHNMNVVVGTCERLVVLNHGKKLAEGRPEDIAANKTVIEAYLGRGFAAGA